jgi:hypothetical protein
MKQWSTTVIRKLFRQVQFFCFAVASAALFAIALNSAFTGEGLVIGHPTTRIVHVYDNAIMQSEVKVAIPDQHVRTVLAKYLPIKDWKRP